MSDQRLRSIDEQGRRLSLAFAAAEAPSKRPGYTRIAVVGALASVAIVVVVALAGLGSSPGPGRLVTIDQAVAAVAKAAYDQPAYPRDKYLYLATRTQNLSGGAGEVNGKRVGFHWLSTFDQETWTRLGEREVRRFTAYPATYLTAADKAAQTKLARGHEDYNASKHVCIRKGGRATKQHSAVAEDLVAAPPSRMMPDDARAMFRYLKRYFNAKRPQGRNANDYVWIMAHALMQAGAPRLTGGQRAALVGALAYLPDVKVLPGSTDPYGVPAVGFERNWIDRHEEVWFDTNTSMLSSMRQKQVKSETQMGGSIPAGTIVWAYRLLDYRFVDSPPSVKRLKSEDPATELLCR